MRKAATSEAADGARILGRLSAAVLPGYVLLIVLFYFLAGEQLHLRESRDRKSTRLNSSH